MNQAAQGSVPGVHRAECLAGYLCFSLAALTGSQVAIGRLPFCALRSSSEVYLKAAPERKVGVF